ncbi:hypothetical protein [Acinetobacter sp. HR7]|uniref:hypothetical protein n=1 Tax=Acinetobacter sp. HR7 TaxID=1509403 RepID=UPI0005367DC0|nr:hypothetical protein [Acinetobacter sp. HR7]KGT46397.1 hypothetical protein GW12_25560 [Acinetobacter sp. HR7]
MSRPVFDHEIFRIAHPVMQKLVGQAVEAKEFQFYFPDFYKYLKEIKVLILANLFKQLIERFEEKTDMSAIEIEKRVDKILFDRQLLNHVIGYCQTNELYLADEYLINDLLQHDEILKIFQNCYDFFWLKIKEYDEINHPISFQKILPIHLKNNNLYLPNLLLEWDIEQLFLDYLSIFIDYHQFNNSKINKENITQQPNAEEAKLVLSKLFKYNSPLPAYNKSFIDASSYDLDATSPEYLSLNIHLDENLNNLPVIINDFLHHLIARKIDRDRKGFNTTIPINEMHFKKIHQARNQLDIVINASSPLKRADTVLSALISLIFYEEVFRRKILEGEPFKFQTINFANLSFEYFDIKLTKDEKVSLEEASTNDLKECINQSNEYDLAQHMDNLYRLISGCKDFKLETSPKKIIDGKIESIFCTKDGALYTHKISKDSLKKTTPDTLSLLSSKLSNLLSL